MSTTKTRTNLTPVAPAVAMKPQTTAPVIEEKKETSKVAGNAMLSIRELPLDQLKTMRENIIAEMKRREAEAKSKAPKKGDRVRIEAKGRFQGKIGTVILSRKTKAFVEVEGYEQPAYASHEQLVKLTDEEVEA